LFTPGTIEESVIRFKPDGTPYGFNRRLPETYVRNPATKALDSTQARALAEDRAHTDWRVDFSQYKMLEHSQQTMKNGRVDHAFVLRASGEKLGDARIRLTLSVKGDELTSVVPFVFVPESFDRRYQELRSANNLIAGAASASAGLLYGIGGCILAVLWLLRRHWLLWRPAFVAGLVVGGLLALSGLAAAPENWFRADTTETLTTFWLKQAGAFIFLLTAAALGYALAFMAAESLSRRAFSAPTAALAAVVARRRFDATNIGPNGWRVPIRSARAGARRRVLLRDEQVARMVAAVRNVVRSEHSRILDSGAVADRDLAAGRLHGGVRFSRDPAIARRVDRTALRSPHAGHRDRIRVASAGLRWRTCQLSGFPSYARLVELIVPSMIWALIFLRFGLLTTVILHVTFDLALFAIPVFSSTRRMHSFNKR
jgi:hypothetical protein